MTEGPVIAYVLQRFPSVSETFIEREIRELLRQGANLNLYALESPRRDETPHDLGADRVFYAQELLRQMPRSQWSSVLQSQPEAVLSELWWLTIRPLPNVRMARAHLKHFSAMLALVAAMRERNTVLVHAHFAYIPAALGASVARLLRVPFTFSGHAWDLFVKPRMLRDKVRRAAAVVTCTEAGRAQVLRLAPEAAEKVRTIRHGVEMPTETRLSTEGAKSGPFALLSVGRLVEKKGFDVLLRACQRLAAEGVEFQCEVVGDGPLRQKLEALSTRLGLEGRVQFVGALPHAEVLDRLRAADCFCLPCRVARSGDRDGVPNVLLEAAAVGVPIVSTTCGGVPEFVEDEVTGLLVPPEDAEALAERLLGICGEPGRARTLAEAALRKVLREYNLAQNGAELLELFRSVIGTSSPDSA